MIVDKIHPKDFYTSGATIQSVEQSLEKLKVKIRANIVGSSISIRMVHCRNDALILNIYNLKLF